MADIVVVAFSFKVSLFFNQSFHFIIVVLIHPFFLEMITLDRSEPLIRTNFIRGNYYQLANLNHVFFNQLSYLKVLEIKTDKHEFLAGVKSIRF